MFRTILVPTDGSPESAKAALAAVELAEQIHGRIVAFSVADPYPFSPLSEFGNPSQAGKYEEKSRAEAQERVEQIQADAASHHVPCETVIETGFSPADEIVSAAERFHCDAIFMASHGRGRSRLFLGSEAQKVVAHAGVPVTIFH